MVPRLGNVAVVVTNSGRIVNLSSTPLFSASFAYKDAGMEQFIHWPWVIYRSSDETLLEREAPAEPRLAFQMSIDHGKATVIA